MARRRENDDAAMVRVSQGGGSPHALFDDAEAGGGDTAREDRVVTVPISQAVVPADIRTPAIPVDAAHEPTFLEIIAQAAKDPHVDIQKMQALLEMRERMMKTEAEIAFNEAMTRLQAKVPRIEKKRAIIVKGQLRSKYAAAEDIDEVLRPLLIEEGFAVSYNTEAVAKETRVTVTIRHRMGHKDSSSVLLPFDKSDFRTDVQSMGATIQYGKRYALCMALNVVTCDEDNDGADVGFISAEEADQLLTLLDTCEIRAGSDERKAFLAFAHDKSKGDLLTTDTVEHIKRGAFDRCLTALRAKERKLRGA